MTIEWTRRALFTVLTGLVVGATFLARRGSRLTGRLGLPWRTTPGNRYRKFSLGNRPLYLSEGLFEAGILSKLRRSDGRRL